MAVAMAAVIDPCSECFVVAEVNIEEVSRATRSYYLVSEVNIDKR